MVLSQQPWLNSSGISGIRTKNCLLMMLSGTGKPRSCILTSEELKAFILPNLSNDGNVTKSLDCTTGRLWLILAYMAHDNAVEPPSTLLREVAVGRVGSFRTTFNQFISRCLCCANILLK